MKNENLFKGIGMVVDDQVNSGKDKAIDGIVKYLENDNHLPLVKYEDLPDNIESICFSSLSFLLLDWELNTLVNVDDSPIPIVTLKAQNARDNVEFIKQVVAKVVIPIFIFSNENVNSIKNTLSQNHIIDDDEKSPIFILNKSELFNNEEKCIMFDKVNEWLKKTPSIYVTQKWKTAYLDAINGMALDMREASPFWPNLLWNCYTDDGVNPSEEISSLINQNALSRIQPVEFDEEILSDKGDANNVVLKNVLERQCFLKKDKLQILSTTGDIYQRGNGKFYLNVRPACDCVGRKGECKVYLIKGKKLSSRDQQTFFDAKYGNFKEQQNFVIVGPVEGAFIRFNFQEMEIKDYEEMKDQRIGRLLPPFITRVTQKYGLYIHRQGLPRLPKEVIPAVAPIEDDNEFEEETMDALQEKIKDSKSMVQQLSKENKELKAKMKRMANSQNCYRLYNCKVTISPSLKRRKSRR